MAAIGMVVAIVAHGCGRDDPAELWFRAQVDYAAGRLVAAEADLQRLSRVRRLGVSESILRSQILGDHGRLDEALAALNVPWLPSRGPEAALIASRCGELELQRYKFRAAEANLKHALELDASRIDARRRLVMLYAQQGRSAEVNVWAPGLATGERLHFLDLVIWTLARREPLDRAELAEVLGKAIQTDPGDRPSRLALAECLRRLGRLDEADSTLNPMTAADAEVRCARARIALDRGDEARALTLLDDGLHVQDHPCLARLHGRLALERGDAASAVLHFRAAFEADPDERDTRFGLAQALRLAGQGEAARPHADLVRALDRLEWLVQRARPKDRRNDPARLKAIGDACLGLGRRDEARAWYQLALSHDPENSSLKNALSQLGSAHVANPRPPG
jgi:tetratricopeptide (TPR) repeat protein